MTRGSGFYIKNLEWLSNSKCPFPVQRCGGEGLQPRAHVSEGPGAALRRHRRGLRGRGRRRRAAAPATPPAAAATPASPAPVTSS